VVHKLTESKIGIPKLRHSNRDLESNVSGDRLYNPERNSHGCGDKLLPADSCLSEERQTLTVSVFLKSHINTIKACLTVWRYGPVDCGEDRGSAATAAVL
jgi:hypothetical protein